MGEEAPPGLVGDLERAAELEHAVLLQYLFAAASLKRRPDEGVDVLELERIRDWERTLLAIAREEMAHLAAVSNLLIAVGGAPWLVRPGLPGGRLRAGEPALVLERFGPGSLARFIALERSGEETISGHYAAIKREIARRAAAGRPVIRAVPVDRVDGWGVSGDARFPPVTDPESALAVIDAIVGQGAAPAGSDSHLGRLLAIEAELGAQAEGFDPARAVADPPAPISDPASATTARTLAVAYQATMLLLAVHYDLVERGSGAAPQVRRAAQGLMSGVVRPLAEILTELPVGDAAPGRTCGPEFAWDPGAALDRPALAAMLTAAGAELGALAREGGPPRAVLVAENLRLAGALVA
ncbi:MAG TPA: ferritin-like domain-containing protein [Solirubrobacteraceae bacterium]|nr:ferritin-like domain-containing protein [Solirubrobacteraceae bacterium]